MMNTLILAGSPRKNGNTNALVEAFAMELPEGRYEIINLYDKKISPCYACRECQREWSVPGCAICDDMQEIFDKVLAADLVVVATPVYSWYCTAPVKAALDRMVYALNKYYDDPDGTHEGKRGPSLWKGKRLALITTCGYPPDKGADLLEEGLQRYCKHSGLSFAGSLVERHMGYQTVFMDEGKAQRAKAFAKMLMDSYTA